MDTLCQQKRDKKHKHPKEGGQPQEYVDRLDYWYKVLKPNLEAELFQAENAARSK